MLSDVIGGQGAATFLSPLLGLSFAAPFLLLLIGG